MGSSICGFIRKPSWANAGYLAWDIGATVIPRAPGSYAAKGARFATKGIKSFKGAKKLKVLNRSRSKLKSYRFNKGARKAVPNPSGKKGGIPHQNKINKVASDIEKRGLTPKYEYKYSTPGGVKNNRYADVVGLDSQGRVAEIHQVGRSTKKYGSPVSREKKAIRILEGQKIIMEQE